MGEAQLIGADLGGRTVAVALDDPGPVVGVFEGVERLVQLLDRLEATHPEQVLLERPDEALGATVTFGLADEGGRRRDAEEGELALEVVGNELAAVIVAQLEAGSHALREAAEAGADTLSDRFEGFEACRPSGGVDADALGRAVVDGDEDRRLTLAVMVDVRSLPHIWSTRSVRIVPSCAFGPRGQPTRPGACRPYLAVRRRTRRLEVRIPAKRSRAQIFR